MLTWSSLNSWPWIQEGPSCFPQSLPRPGMTALHLLRPPAQIFSSSFSTDDLVSCVLKMKAIKRKPVHVSLHLCPCSAFPVLLWPLPQSAFTPSLVKDFALLQCVPHLPACQCTESSVFTIATGLFLSAYSYGEILPIFKNNDKNLPNTASFFSYCSPKVVFVVTSTPNLFGSPTIPFFLFYSTITALVEILVTSLVINSLVSSQSLSHWN